MTFASCLASADRAESLHPLNSASYPPTAPSSDTLLGADPNDLSKAPAYLSYDDQWKPDGTVQMKGSCPSLQGSWRALCYSTEKAASLGVDMQGFRIPSAAHDTAVSRCPENEAMATCVPKLPAMQVRAQGSLQHDVQAHQHRHPLQIDVHILVGRDADVHLDSYKINNIFAAFDTDGDNRLDLLETLLLAKQLSHNVADEGAFPFPFQNQVMISMLRADMDGDRQVHLRPDEFTAWCARLRHGKQQFTFSPE